MTQASILTPTTIDLVQTKQEIPYKEMLTGFPVIHLGLATPFRSYGEFQTYGLFKAGFSYKRGQTEIADISLLWVPLSVGTKIQYTPPEFPFVRPSLSLGLGAQFIHQGSSAPELETSAWLPFYYVTPMIGFFEGGSEWFNGFTFGISFIDSVAVSQKVRSWSFDLSFSFLL